MDRIKERRIRFPGQPGSFRVFWRENRALGLAFLIPFLLMLAAFALESVYPAGDRQILNYDAWHQYYPFWMQLHDHLREGTSLLYDPDMGLGTNFLSLLSYYGASPLNLLTVLFAARDLRILFTLLTAVRIGLAGCFCAYFLKKVFRRSDLSLAFFGSCYALCGYVTGYYWNVMWLDCVALLPLLALGLVSLFREGKFRLYTLVLALTLFCNYYIAYMCCIFMVLAFLVLCVVDRPRWSQFWRKALRFALFSFLGAALAAVMLLPAYFGLQNTYSVSSASPSSVFFYENFLDLFAGLADFHDPTYLDGLPNVSAGALTALFAFLFFLSRRIRLREKIAALALTVFFFFSMNVNVLDWAWHGFHFTNQIPFRFSFLFSFVLVVMAYRYFSVGAGRMDAVDLGGGFLYIAFLLYCAWRVYPDLVVVVTAAVLSLSILLVLLHAKEFLNKRVFAASVSVILFAEAASSAWLGVRAVGTTDYAGYYDGERGERIQAAVETVKEIEGDAFYRMEVTEARSLNDSCFYRYPGVTQFASSANTHVARFCEAIGLAADDGSNRYAYVMTTPLNNTLLGVKYVMSKTGRMTDTDLREVKTGFRAAFSLYEYEGFIGQGFMMPEAAASFDFERGMYPAEIQNAMFRAATGLDKDYLTVIDMTNVGHKNLDVDRYALGDYRFTVEDASEDSTYLKFNYTMPSTGMVYVFADIPEAEYVQVNNAWHSISEYPNFFSAGYFRQGETFVLRANIDETLYEGGSVHLYVCVLDTEVWREGLERMRDEALVWDHREATLLEGHITAKEDGYLYTSVPYEEPGWRVFVDGAEAEVEPFAGAFVGVRLSAGEHRIRMTYSPGGFSAGWKITLGAIVLFAALVFLSRKKEYRLLTADSELAPRVEEEPEEPEEPSPEDALFADAKEPSPENAPFAREPKERELPPGNGELPPEEEGLSSEDGGEAKRDD